MIDHDFLKGCAADLVEPHNQSGDQKLGEELNNLLIKSDRAGYLLRVAAEFIKSLGVNSIQVDFDGSEQDSFWLEEACRDLADELKPSESQPYQALKPSEPRCIINGDMLIETYANGVVVQTELGRRITDYEPTLIKDADL